MSSTRPYVQVPTPQQSWLSSSSHLAHKTLHRLDLDNASARSSTPDALKGEPATVQSDADSAEEEQQRVLFKELYLRHESRLANLFGDGNAVQKLGKRKESPAQDDMVVDEPRSSSPKPDQGQQPPKKKARVIDEDNYDDEDEEDEEDVPTTDALSKHKSTNALMSPSKSGSSPVSTTTSPIKRPEQSKDAVQQLEAKTSEDARKQLEEERKATEETAKRNLHTLYYTLENDRVAMLEQQKLEESEKQIDAEMDHGGNTSNGVTNTEQHGSLSSANLGASSLTLKHLIARIDQKRERVKASDAELRALMNEVRKNRSKWASEENVGQEELYEAAEKVLSELKAITEYSTPFLTRVNKREAPDYYNIIKQPMDLGSMTKKLKTLVYKSKAEFVHDLDLIWNNCLRYNDVLSHPLRRNANAMRKEAEKLVPLIPDLVIRPRAEVEAEERRKQNGGEDDAADDSDDEPIMSSRGRTAGTKGAAKARKATREDSTPGVEQKPVLQVNGIVGHLNREGSDAGIEGSQNGNATPPIGSITPGGINGFHSQVDGMDLDGPLMNGISLNHALGAAADDMRDDEEYKLWKQLTKKDRAIAARDRHRLFRGDKLNPDEPALLRTKAGMRRWMRQQKQSQEDSPAGDKPIIQASETLAEGLEGEQEKVVPDYYDPLSAIPDIPSHLQWLEDSNGHLLDRPGEYVRLIPSGHFTSPQAFLTEKVEANMRQMQDTRKLCSKIGVIKQMQLQAQIYNNQFPRYEPQPFVEADIEPHVTTDDGPVMATWVCKAAMQRSVSKICYHAGFEELQPSALDVITDLAGDFFGKLAQTFGIYRETPKAEANAATARTGQRYQERYTNEEVVLHTLGVNGLDVEALESYVKDDVERLGSKLGIMHERMKSHLGELLRPALADGGADGSGAFQDGSEQFVGGDFAEELGEDFFGFKALGLDSEFDMGTLSVPLHLLHTRIYQGSSTTAIQQAAAEVFAPLPPFEPVTKENMSEQIGLIQEFLKRRLRANDDEPLVEDEDLPIKQRPARPRLGPTGKILAPRKRPLKEQNGNIKKKKKLENGTVVGGEGVKGESPIKKLKLKMSTNGVEMERVDSLGGNGTDKDEIGMMSPESIER